MKKMKLKNGLMAGVFILLASIGMKAQTATANNASQLISQVNDSSITTILIPRGSNFNISSRLVLNRQLTIQATGSGAQPIINMTNGSDRLLDVRANNVTLRDLDLRGVNSSTNNNHIGIQAIDRANLTVTDCSMSRFVQCISATNLISNVGNWLIRGCTFESFHRRGIAINRGRPDANASSIGGRLRIIRNTFTIGNSEPQHPRNRAISIDGGNTGVPILDLRNTLIRNNDFTNCGIALSRIKNIDISGSNNNNGNNFIANRELLDEPVHIEELCESITFRNNAFDFNGNFNTNNVMIDINGSRDITIENNTATGLTEHFLLTGRYNHNIKIENNNLSGVTLPSGEDEVIRIAGCGANEVVIDNNTIASDQEVFVLRGTFRWDLLASNSPNLSLFFGPSPNNNSSLVNNFENFYNNVAGDIEFLSENFYYRCNSNNDNCLNSSTLGTASGGDITRLRNMNTLCDGRNFFGGRNNNNLTAFGNANRPITGRESPTFDGTSSKEVEISSGIFVYPNPVSLDGTLNITRSLATKALLSIYDLQGKVVKIESIEDSNASINVSSLHSGLFLIKIEEAGEIVYSNKLIIK